MDLMPIEHIEDWEKRLLRQEAFWERQVIDRPVVCITLPKKNPSFPKPAKKDWPNQRERWLDGEYQAEARLSAVMNTAYLGDALPTAFPNLGPEVFSAFFGAELEFGETTSWSVPNLHSWDDVGELQFSEDSFYWRKLVEMTDLFLQVGRGRFYTGITDLHPGGDAIAAFRDPMNLAVDMIEHKEEVKKLLERVTQVFFMVMDFFYEKLTSHGQPLSTWIGIVSRGKWYVPSNDFSCMISEEMFNEVFLPGLIEECRFLDHSIYHLDGPGALRHLDALLDIRELDAIQWVAGAGNGPPSRWLDVYRRCQRAGKGLWISLHVNELDLFMENLRPEGLWLQVHGVQNAEHAEAILRQVSRWPRG